MRSAEEERRFQARWAFHDRCREAERKAPKAWGPLVGKEVRGPWMVLRFQHGATSSLEIPPLIQDNPWWMKDPHRPGGPEPTPVCKPEFTSEEAPQRVPQRDHWGLSSSDHSP